MPMTRLISLMFFFVAGVVRAETQVIELHSASPESLIPVVQPLLGPWESVSAFRTSLVVNAAPETLRRVAELVAKLDRPLRNLLISLRRGGNSAREDAHAGEYSTSSNRDTREQQVRTLESSPVMVREGSLVPLAVGGLLGPQIVWGQADSGFVISARVDGDTVTLDIDIQDGRVQSGTLRNGALRSSLRGALGSWIELGSSSTRAVRISADEDATYSTRERDKLGYELKVELLP